MVLSWQKRAARKRGIPGPECGAVTFCQRFGSLLNLNVHARSLLPDGVFARTASGVEFISLPPPWPEDIQRLTQQIARATEKLLARHQQAYLAEQQPPELLDIERAQTIAIPRVVVLPKGVVRAGFNEFDLDLSAFRLQPVSKEILQDY